MLLKVLPNQLGMDAEMASSSYSWEERLREGKFEFVVNGISLSIVCALGLLTNIVCLVVMNKRALKKGPGSKINALLLGLAGVDIVVLLCR